MKKYIFTEGQVKKILDNVVEEKLITEQTEQLNFKKTIQCFLKWPSQTFKVKRKYTL